MTKKYVANTSALQRTFRLESGEVGVVDPWSVEKLDLNAPDHGQIIEWEAAGHISLHDNKGDAAAKLAEAMGETPDDDELSKLAEAMDETPDDGELSKAQINKMAKADLKKLASDNKINLPEDAKVDEIKALLVETLIAEEE